MTTPEILQEKKKYLYISIGAFPSVSSTFGKFPVSAFICIFFITEMLYEHHFQPNSGWWGTGGFKPFSPHVEYVGGLDPSLPASGPPAIHTLSVLRCFSFSAAPKDCQTKTTFKVVCAAFFILAGGSHNGSQCPRPDGNLVTH